MTGGSLTYPLPERPALAEVGVDPARGRSLGAGRRRPLEAGVRHRRELRLTFGAFEGLAPFAVGEHFFGPEAVRVALGWRMGLSTTELYRSSSSVSVASCWPTRPEVATRSATSIDAGLVDVVDQLTPNERVCVLLCVPRAGSGPCRWASTPQPSASATRAGLAGTAIITKPDTPMGTIGVLTSMGDTGHVERMQLVAKSARRPAAILFADLEGSSPLARADCRPPATSRSGADWCAPPTSASSMRAVSSAGTWGTASSRSSSPRHLGSESAAAHAAIDAARALDRAMADVAARSGLGPDDVGLRFGLHWGSTLYVGNITTAGRTEVTALGDEVNEAARIEACATGGRTLASKNLIERLDDTDAARLGLDPDAITYIAARGSRDRDRQGTEGRARNRGLRRIRRAVAPGPQSPSAATASTTRSWRAWIAAMQTPVPSRR